MKTHLIAIFCLVSISLMGQKTYAPAWESLDTRPVLSWFENAKFGIFIHWGLYSVPMWSPKGTYSEWYKYWLDRKTLLGNGDFTGTEVYDYHKKMYGEDFTYADFAPMFKAMSYDANEWADLFKRAGAKYIVLTTKHHEGFALWPSKEASKSYGRPWNSMEIGAHRDLVGEYVNALRKTDLKVGCYFSLREWDNPLYNRETMDLFYERHFFPQLKDLVNNYKPDLIWADYTLPQALVLTLVNVVSQGGNLLLGIGPNANGKIPPIMQERLLQIGDWLRVNGEAIYGTRMWKQSFQWSKGNREWKPKGKHYVSGNEILKQTIHPEPGYAVKEVFFTKKGNDVYAILPQYPKPTVILKGIKVTNKTRISMLGLDKKIVWKQKGEDIVITVPSLYYDEMPCNYAWTLKLENVI